MRYYVVFGWLGFVCLFVVFCFVVLLLVVVVLLVLFGGCGCGVSFGFWFVLSVLFCFSLDWFVGLWVCVGFDFWCFGFDLDWCGCFVLGLLFGVDFVCFWFWG